MEVNILYEAGYNLALTGLSLSYNTKGLEKLNMLMEKLAFGKPGENKFLESIQVWLDVRAPRFWWQEADTYRVGQSKQSESTMHTIFRKELTQEDFEGNIFDETLQHLNEIINKYKLETNSSEKLFLLQLIKNNLPEGFLQRRIWNVNYKTLQNIYKQRHNHKLTQWKYFCSEIKNNLRHPEFIG